MQQINGIGGNAEQLEDSQYNEKGLRPASII